MDEPTKPGNDRRIEPLTFRRADCPPGTRIGLPDETLVRALSCADELVLALQFSQLGDSLLYLAAAQACHESFVLLQRREPRWIIVGDQGALLRHSPLLRDAVVLKTSNEFLEYAATSDHRLFVVTDNKDLPSQPQTYVYRKTDNHYPIYTETLPDGTGQEYRCLPARYYLTFERQVGRVLMSPPSEAHPGFLFPDDELLANSVPRFGDSCQSSSEALLCALIATTSLPEQKQFGAARFVEVATTLRQEWPEKRFDIVLVLSPSPAESGEDHLIEPLGAFGKEAGVITCRNSRLDELGYLFARATIVIGNDTGLTHLAGLSRRPPPYRPPRVIQLYSRHDYTRWTSGRANVYPLFTPFSQYLREHNLATITDRVNDDVWRASSSATAIGTADVVALAHRLLAEDLDRAPEQGVLD